MSGPERSWPRRLATLSLAVLSLAAPIVAAVAPGAAAAAPAAAAEGDVQPLGTRLGPQALSGYVSIPPDGAGLPPGQGTAAGGEVVWRQDCASCHGVDLHGQKAIGAPALVGGRGTLATPHPLRTVESYWPYATTLFDYIRRAMPMTAPGSLSPDQVYAVCAFILTRGHIEVPSGKLDARSLPRVQMPNRDGFITDPTHGAPLPKDAPG